MPIPEDKMREVSVVIPVYNNADTLGELYLRLRKVFEKSRCSYEIIFVDDASFDNSCSVITDIAGRDPGVRLFKFERNNGQQKTVFWGLKNARGRLVITMDADLQDPPEAIPELLSKIQEGYAVAFAGRKGWYESSLRLLTSRLFKRVMHLVTGVPVDAGMFLVMTEEAKNRILSFKGRPFMVAMLGCTGLSLVSIPVERSRRKDNTSGYTHGARLGVALSAIFWAILWKWRLDRYIK